VELVDKCETMLAAERGARRPHVDHHSKEGGDKQSDPRGECRSVHRHEAADEADQEACIKRSR